jgi:hypothetical protein
MPYGVIKNVHIRLPVRSQANEDSIGAKNSTNLFQERIRVVEMFNHALEENEIKLS